jgi:SAM-dependent methyltransferase
MENIILLEKLDKRELVWDQSKLLERDCSSCSSSERNPIYQRPDKLIVNHCKVCGLYYISPAPSEQQLIDFYLNYRVSYVEKSRFFDRNKIVQIDILNFQLNSSLLFSEISSIRNIQGLKWCDVGCGTGNLLYVAQLLGAIPYGCDIDPDAVIYANKVLELNNVIQGSIFQFSSNSKFDVISMMDFSSIP